jgi:hypothetical protein
MSTNFTFNVTFLQENEASLEVVQQLASQFHQRNSLIVDSASSQASGWGMLEFADYLTSHFNVVCRPLQMREVYQDMTRPLCDYYVNSSHNTYLEGNQLSSRSSVDMYARVLKQGCRCVECE